MQKHWVFGYGSLMWNTGFPYLERQKAVVQGYHRSLCLFSYHYRGTKEKPGLVLALDEGGSCEGLGFAVADSEWDKVLAYLREREQISYVYLEREVQLQLADTGEDVTAITYVVDSQHDQYAGKLSLAETLRYINQGVGSAGPCRDYVVNTLSHLREINVHDAYLEEIGTRL